MLKIYVDFSEIDAKLYLICYTELFGGRRVQFSNVAFLAFEGFFSILCLLAMKILGIIKDDCGYVILKMCSSAFSMRH